ncbi:MAG: hypothetical protein QXX68_02905 [Candidatus Pacearchaeota archaeon]
MVKNKKGWLRIAEAFIAVVLIIGAITILFFNKEGKKEDDSYIRDIQKDILEEIATKEQLRNIALKKNETELKDKIQNVIPEVFSFDIKICNLNESYCLMNREYPKKDVFVEERVISGNLSLYEPIRVRLFLWRKD